MKLKLEKSGRNFDMGFRYDRDNGITSAYIKDTDENLEFVGKAVLSDEDQFNKKIGRKVALARIFAEYNYYFDYDLRTDIWQTLKNRGMKLV